MGGGHHGRDDRDSIGPGSQDLPPIRRVDPTDSKDRQVNARTYLLEDLYPQGRTVRSLRRGEIDRPEQEEIGPPLLSLQRLVERMAGDSEEPPRAYKATGHRGGETLLGEMDSVSPHGQCDIDTVVHEEHCPRGLYEMEEPFSQSAELAGLQVLLPELKSPRPSLQGGLDHLLEGPP
jgi:hypothetical protein